MAKTKTITSLRNKLWKLTSLYVRLRGSDFDDNCSCVTCGHTRHYKEMQAGHFIPKAQGNATAWDLRNIHPQCYRCNINLGGNGAEYFPFMLKTYGSEVVDELRQLSNTSRKISRVQYEEMIEHLQQKLQELIKQRENPTYWQDIEAQENELRKHWTHWALQNIS